MPAKPILFFAPDHVVATVQNSVRALAEAVGRSWKKLPGRDFDGVVAIDRLLLGLDTRADGLLKRWKAGWTKKRSLMFDHEHGRGCLIRMASTSSHIRGLSFDD
jgi:hypothetical protein